MTVAQNDYTIEQGEDAVWSVTYTIGGTPIDSTWKARMDIAPKGNVATPAATLWSFNSVDFTGGVDDKGQPLDVVGQSDNEITVDTGGVITIRVDKSLTLPGGKLGEKVAQGVTQFSYDLFVRDAADGSQTKIMQGTITVNRSTTLWA